MLGEYPQVHFIVLNISEETIEEKNTARTKILAEVSDSSFSIGRLDIREAETCTSC